MRHILLIILLACVVWPVKAQKKAFPGGKTYIFRMELRDKKGCAYDLRHPERFLSAKALSRRNRQNLSVDSTDLPLSETYLSAIRDGGFQIVGGSKWNNTVLVRTDYQEAENRLNEFPFVTKVTMVFAAPDSVDIPYAFPLRRDTVHVKQDSDVYGNAGPQLRQLGGDKLHEAGYRGQGMTIAIIDGGFMNVDRIPALHKVKILGRRDFVYPFDADVTKLLDHGERVLACMAAVDSFRYIGTAPEASYYLLRSETDDVEAPYEEDTWAMAAEYADSVGVDVINSSLGYADFDKEYSDIKYADLDGHHELISHTASMLASKGIILVCSAGNEGLKAWKKITVPADADDVLTVGAVTPKGINASFSSVGNSQDGRVKPDVMACGERSATISGRGTYGISNGTSFASPIACGMVACLWQALPKLTAHEIIELVRRSGDRVQTPDNIFGYGIPDFWKAYNSAR